MSLRAFGMLCFSIGAEYPTMSQTCSVIFECVFVAVIDHTIQKENSLHKHIEKCIHSNIRKEVTIFSVLDMYNDEKKCPSN